MAWASNTSFVGQRFSSHPAPSGHSLQYIKEESAAIADTFGSNRWIDVAAAEHEQFPENKTDVKTIRVEGMNIPELAIRAVPKANMAVAELAW